MAGTHVAGTVAGCAHGTNCTADASFATGVAPGAKLALISLASITITDPGLLYNLQYKVCCFGCCALYACLLCSWPLWQ
jgi:hypothetical protein